MLDPGEAAEVPVRVKARRRRLLGAAVTRPFHVDLGASSNVPIASLRGTSVSARCFRCGRRWSCPRRRSSASPPPSRCRGGGDDGGRAAKGGEATPTAPAEASATPSAEPTKGANEKKTPEATATKPGDEDKTEDKPTPTPSPKPRPKPKPDPTKTATAAPTVSPTVTTAPVFTQDDAQAAATSAAQEWADDTPTLAPTGTIDDADRSPAGESTFNCTVTIPLASGTPPSCAFTVTVNATNGKYVNATDQDGSD